jgi:flagellar hook-basal body complex protein FliE
MSSPIAGISAIAGPPAPIAPISAATETDQASASTGAGFGEMIGKAIANTQRVQDNADTLAVKAASGDLADAHQYLAAATEASLTTQLTTAVRNKAVDAFNEIMRLQA